MTLGQYIAGLGSQFSSGEQIGRQRRAQEGISQVFSSPNLTPAEQIKQTGLEFGKAGFGQQAQTALTQAEGMGLRAKQAQRAETTQKLNIIKTVGPLISAALSESPEKAKEVTDTLLRSDIGNEVAPILQMMSETDALADQGYTITYTEDGGKKVANYLPKKPTGQIVKKDLGKPVRTTAEEKAEGAKAQAVEKRKLEFPDKVAKKTDDFDKTVRAASDALRSLEAGSSISDVGVSYQAARVFEPGGRLSDPDVQRFAGNPKAVNQAQRIYNKLIKGVALTDEDREDFRVFFNLNRSLAKLEKNKSILNEVIKESNNLGATTDEMLGKVGSEISPINGILATFIDEDDYNRLSSLIEDRFKGSRIIIGNDVFVVE